MGLFQAIKGTIGGGLADQWLETIEPAEMGEGIVFTKGVSIKRDKRGSNTKGTTDVISNGSMIHVYDNQCMLLVDGGQIVDFTAEPGMYKVDNSSVPSLFSGELGKSVLETFKRFKYGGDTPYKQMACYVNLQEIKGINFGTPNPINYFDNFYNSELFLRTYGNYSLKIVDPVLFYKEAIPRDAATVHIDDINKQYLSEFLEALQSAMNQMSVDNIRISHVASKGRELSKYMADILDENWRAMRGMEIQAVGIASISYDDESKELINMRNRGAMLSDPSVREGYVQGSVARGMEAAGSNEGAGGAGMSFMGMGLGMNAAGGFMGQASNTNFQQMQMQQQQAPQPTPNLAGAAGAAEVGWLCSCGRQNSGKFCAECGNPKPAPVAQDNDAWTCSCGQQNTGKFCAECGNPKPQQITACPECGFTFDSSPGKFCPECGKKL